VFFRIILRSFYKNDHIDKIANKYKTGNDHDVPWKNWNDRAGVIPARPCRLNAENKINHPFIEMPDCNQQGMI
jgi:hypothetical protein